MDSLIHLSSDLSAHIATLLNRFDDLQAILVSTFEGVPLIKVCNPDTDWNDAETVLPTILAVAADQVGKLQFGPVQSITAYYTNNVIIHIHDYPLIITLIAIRSPQAATLLKLGNDLAEGLLPLKKCIESADVQQS